jgi:hypothetical protein
MKISIVANHSSFLFLKTIVHFNLVFPTNLTFSLKVSNDVFAAFYTVQNIDSTIFYAYSSDSIFPDPSNDCCGFREIEIYHPNSPENWQNPSFYVGIMPTIIFPGMEVEDGGG